MFVCVLQWCKGYRHAIGCKPGAGGWDRACRREDSGPCGFLLDNPSGGADVAPQGRTIARATLPPPICCRGVPRPLVLGYVPHFALPDVHVYVCMVGECACACAHTNGCAGTCERRSVSDRLHFVIRVITGISIWDHETGQCGRV